MAPPLGPDDTVFLTDDGDHTVRKCTLDGKILLTIGVPGKAAPYQGGEPFNRCTHVAFSPQGDIYVSDGYGNSRVHKYSPDGKLLLSWGESGSDPGQFNIVHNIVTDKDGWVYVADRENNRVQVFDGNGKYETQWNNMHRPCALYMDTTKKDPICYVGELGPGLGVNKDAPNLGNRVDIYDKTGKRLARLGDICPGEKPGQFIAPHGIAIDSRGDIYVGEVSWTIMGQRLQPPRELRSLQKLEKAEIDRRTVPDAPRRIDAPKQRVASRLIEDSLLRLGTDERSNSWKFGTSSDEFKESIYAE